MVLGVQPKTGLNSKIHWIALSLPGSELNNFSAFFRTFFFSSRDETFA